MVGWSKNDVVLIVSILRFPFLFAVPVFIIQTQLRKIVWPQITLKATFQSPLSLSISGLCASEFVTFWKLNEFDGPELGVSTWNQGRLLLGLRQVHPLPQASRCAFGCCKKKKKKKETLGKAVKRKAVLCCLLLGSNVIDSRRLKSRWFFAWLLWKKTIHEG